MTDYNKQCLLFLDFFFFLFLFVVVCFSLPSLMLSGGDVRPLALVVIGRGQITTPYILVIPSEGDYCFVGRLLSFLSSILPSPNDHKQSTAPLFESSSLPTIPDLFFLSSSSSLPMAALFACLLCFECCWLFNLSVLSFFLSFLLPRAGLFSAEPL